VIRTDASDALGRLPHRFHRRRFRNERRQDSPLKTGVLFLQTPASAKRAPQLQLRLHRRDELVIVPGFFDVVARAAAHGLHRARDAAPSGHDQHGQRRVDGPHSIEQLEAFLPGRRVTRVVEVDQGHVEVGTLELVDQLGGRRRGRDFIALAPQQKFQGIENVDLVVGDEHAAQGSGHGRICYLQSGSSPYRATRESRNWELWPVPGDPCIREQR
jgi:hypothetical protein